MLLIPSIPVAVVSVMISQSQGLFALSKPCVTRGSSFGDDFSVQGLFPRSKQCGTRGTSFVDDSESLGSLYAVESKRPPWLQFR